MCRGTGASGLASSGYLFGAARRARIFIPVATAPPHPGRGKNWPPIEPLLPRRSPDFKKHRNAEKLDPSKIPNDGAPKCWSCCRKVALSLGHKNPAWRERGGGVALVVTAGY
jgi:hypothetical protein